jgi:ABC-type transport system involved in multi-copper enzyme maturation permease subunit
MGGLAIARLSVIETMRRKEFYVVFVLVIGLAMWMQFLDLTSSGAGRFAKDIVLQITWLASFALAAPIAARQVIADVEQKTIYVIMARPVQRWQYVFGRAAGACAASITCFTAMYAVLLLMLLCKGAAAISDPVLWQAFALQLVALVMLCCTAICLSIRGTASGAVTFSLLLFAMMRYGSVAFQTRIEHMQGFLGNIAWTAYLIMPHFEFFSISQRVVHAWGPLPMVIFVWVMIYGLCYSVFVTGLGAYLFRKRWL